MKLGIVVGHTRNRQGAHSQTLAQSEYPWNSDLAERIQARAGDLEHRVFFRDGHGIKGAYRQADDWGATVTVELHFNASDNAHATGTGVLYFPGSVNGKRLATLLREEMGTALELPDWPSGTGGVVTPFQASGKQERGKTSLGAGRAPAALIEPFFGSNPDDATRANARKDALAEAIVRAARRYDQG